MTDNHTINYYNFNAEKFYNSTVNIDFSITQKRFISKLQKNAYILDFGCGSGRDTKYFLEHDFLVDAIDGSTKMCELASKYTGIKVKNILFQNFAEINKYDGIWACSSILHLPINELTDVMQKMATALKYNGIIYTSFKYGDFVGEKKERHFTDMTEKTFEQFIKKIKNLEIEEQWITTDLRPGRDNEKWLNIILRKNS